MNRWCDGSRPILLAFCLCCVCIVGIRAAEAQDAPALPIEVAANDPHVRYIGRFDTQDAAGPRCTWSASAIQLKFRGTALNVKLKEAGNDAYQVIVDGKPTSILKTKSSMSVYPVAAMLPNTEHTVMLVKRTEAFVGTTQILGFQLEQGAKLLALPPRQKHRIEVIGDSISCGYGNEGKDQNEHFSPTTENAYLTYGAIAARTLGAEYVCLAWSGRKMWPDNTMGEIYGRTLATDSNSKWDFTQWVPDVVVIHLATNDFGKDNPDQRAWTQGYEAFLTRVRKAYPKAEIYCACGSMMSDDYPPGHKALSTVITYLNQIVADEKRAGDTRVHFLQFATQDMKNGLGSDWHPNVKTHEIMAATLVEALKTDLHWKPVATP